VRQAEEDHGKKAAIVTTQAKQNLKIVTLAFQQAVVPVLRETSDWLRTQLVSTRLYEENSHPRCRSARLLVFPLNFPEAEPGAPYIGFRFDEDVGEVYCFMQMRDGKLNDTRHPGDLRWKPHEITREAVLEATYSYLDQLFRAHRRPAPTADA
jgi:hypothetical protein